MPFWLPLVLVLFDFVLRLGPGDTGALCRSVVVGVGRRAGKMLCCPSKHPKSLFQTPVHDAD
jgi:hypothetical protein